MDLPKIPGVTITRSLIYRRPLGLAHSLCWRRTNLGLMSSEKFQWNPAIGKIEDGRERADAVRAHWISMEEPFNVLLDTAFQAYRDDLATALGLLFNTRLEVLEHLEVVVDRALKRELGRPDTVLIDCHNKTLVFIEMKLGSKYEYKQHVKYLTLNALVPDFRTFTLVLAPGPRFGKASKNMSEAVRNDPDYGQVELRYATGAAEQIAIRLKKITKLETKVPRLERFPLYFASWKQFARHLPEGLLRENVVEMVDQATRRGRPHP